MEDSETYVRDRERLREFVRRWAEAGPALEEQRYAELQDLGDERARRMTIDLFELWRPSELDDLGAGLVEQQTLLAKLRRREAQKDHRR